MQELFTKNLVCTHSTVTFSMLFETFHCNSILSVTPRLNPEAFSRNSMSNLVRMLNLRVILFSANVKRQFLLKYG